MFVRVLTKRSISDSEADPRADRLSEPEADFIELRTCSFLSFCGTKFVHRQEKGYAHEPYEWSPGTVDIQILRIGNLVILVAPGEFTTMAGRRMR